MWFLKIFFIFGGENTFCAFLSHFYRDFAFPRGTQDVPAGAGTHGAPATRGRPLEASAGHAAHKAPGPRGVHRGWG